MESDGQRSIVYRNPGCNNDIFSHRHNSSGLHGYNNRYTDSKSAADRGCYRHTCSHLSEPEFNNSCNWRKHLYLESYRQWCVIYGNTNHHNDVQCDRLNCSRLYRYIDSNVDSKSTADCNSHSNTCSHLHRPEFYDCGRRGKYLYMESGRHRFIVYSQPDQYNYL